MASQRRPSGPSVVTGHPSPSPPLYLSPHSSSFSSSFSRSPSSASRSPLQLLLLATLLLLLLLSAVAEAEGAVVSHDWQVGYVADVNPDGRFARRAIGVNGAWPPPVLNTNSTDELRITVTNKLGDGNGTALHSHGMFFNGTGFYDGAVGITQCPIPPDESVTYSVLNAPEQRVGHQPQWGTYWTHGHYRGQYVDGLRTPSVIHRADAPEVYQYDDDYTVVLADWYHDEHAVLHDQFLNWRNPTGAEPVPESGLLYFAHTARSNPIEAPLLPGFNANATLPFEAGKTYRLRIINMAALAMFQFWIEGHEMRIIEADGTDIQEYPIDVLPIAVAQRYSVLVTARNDSRPANWTMHANMDPDMFDTVPETTQLNLTATVSYPGATSVAVTDRSEVASYVPLDDSRLVPTSVEATPDVADVVHELHVSFDTHADGKNYGSFNNKTYVSPLTPSLLTASTMGVPLAQDAAVYGGSQTEVLVLPHLALAEVVLYNWDAGNHPFHLHGAKFAVVWRSHDVTSSDPTVNPPFDYARNVSSSPTSFSNPMRRDTVTVPGGGAVRLRWRVDNPGAWFFHCHIDWHLSSGLAAVFVQSPELLNADAGLVTPEWVTRQCDAQAPRWKSRGNAGGVANSTTEFGALPSAAPYLETGWTAKAVGAMTACVATALLGMVTVVVYGLGGGAGDDEEEGEEEERGDEGGHKAGGDTLGTAGTAEKR